MKVRLYTLLWLVSCALPVASSAGESSAAAKCDGLYRFTDFNNAIEPGVLVPASGDTPAHCRVRGVIDGTIRFEVTLPVEGWQGRLWFHAVGGSAGRIGDTTSLLGEGFAMASTDAGHDEAVMADANTFFRDQLAVTNYGYRSIHLTTVLAKQIISRFYGEENEHAYIWGCSNGGRTVFNELLRFPDDFDGAIAGAPTIDLVRDLLPWNVAGSRLQREHPLTVESLALLDANSRNRCDLLDGLEDGVISEPQSCTVDVLRLEALQCGERQSADCLTAGQIETARLMYDGIRDEAGNVVSPGVYPGGEAEGDWMLWVTGNPAFMPVSANEASVALVEHLFHDDPSFNIDEFDVVHDRQALAEQGLAIDPPAGDFSRYRRHGGKLIIYQGWSDFPVRADRLLKYLDKAEDLTGGPRKMADFHRLYMVPGMLHCTGGPGAWSADYVQPIVNWVEKGEAPKEIVATQPGITNWFEASGASGGGVSWYHNVMQAGSAKEDAKTFTRPLCPYPQYAKHRGGDPDDASSFECVVDETDKVSFASREWFEMVREVITTFAAENPELNFSMNEVFTHVPERLNPGPDGRAAFVMEFNNGKSDLRLEEIPTSEVDIKVVARWSAVVPAAIYVVDDNSPESVAAYTELGRRARESGDLVVEISSDFKGTGSNELHNRIAARTKP